MDNIFDQHASENIIFVTESFEGPIQLLVELARKNNLDIHTLKITDIIDQYLEFVSKMETLDLDIATDFLLMAATLLEIKARAVLPNDYEEEDVFEDDISPEEEIRRRMLEYAMFKEKAEELKSNETLNRFYREPKYTDEDVRITIKDFSLEKLMEAFAKVIVRFNNVVEDAPIKKIERDTYTVAQQIDFLVNELIDKKEMNFFDIFSDSFSKSEVINTFLALLQIVGKQFASVDQDTPMGDIKIKISDECDINEFDYTVLAMGEEDNFDGKHSAND